MPPAAAAPISARPAPPVRTPASQAHPRARPAPKARTATLLARGSASRAPWTHTAHGKVGHLWPLLAALAQVAAGPFPWVRDRRLAASGPLSWLASRAVWLGRPRVLLGRAMRWMARVCPVRWATRARAALHCRAPQVATTTVGGWCRWMRVSSAQLAASIRSRARPLWRVCRAPVAQHPQLQGQWTQRRVWTVLRGMHRCFQASPCALLAASARTQLAVGHASARLARRIRLGRAKLQRLPVGAVQRVHRAPTLQA